MLRPPYTRYSRLYTYHLGLENLPAINDPDLIGTWIEDETAILFFHRPEERLARNLCEASGAKVIYEADLDYTDWEAGREIAINTALDLGCGTGLLAIAAAKQGVGRITACDNNQLACQMARANCQANGVQDRVAVLEADLRRQCPETRVDLVMANLYKGGINAILMAT